MDVLTQRQKKQLYSSTAVWQSCIANAPVKWKCAVDAGGLRFQHSQREPANRSLVGATFGCAIAPKKPNRKHSRWATSQKHQSCCLKGRATTPLPSELCLRPSNEARLLSCSGSTRKKCSSSSKAGGLYLWCPAHLSILLLTVLPIHDITLPLQSLCQN